MKWVLLLLIPCFLFSSETRILVLGDSNSYGVPNRECSWVSLLQKEYKDNPDVVFLNYSVGMSTAEQCEMLYIIANEIHNPQVVIYAGGLVNVLLEHNLENMKISLKRTLTQCALNNQTVLFGTIDFSCWIDAWNRPIDYISDANRIYNETPSRFNVIPFVFLDTNLMANPHLNLGDYVHPNIDGQKIIAERIKQKLDYALRRIN